MDDQRGRARYDNGNTADENRRKDRVDWDQMLLETNIDQWDIDDRREMKANLQWVSEHRRTLGSRQRLRATLYAAALAIMVAFISWLSPWNVRTTLICPTGYTCTQTPTTPTPLP